MQTNAFAQAAARIAVFVIANNRAVKAGQLHAYLMRAAGYRVNLYQVIAIQFAH